MTCFNGLGKTLNVGSFSDYNNFDKLCGMKTSIELYTFVQVSVTLIEFQGHSDVGKVEAETVFYVTRL